MPETVRISKSVKRIGSRRRRCRVGGWPGGAFEVADRLLSVLAEQPVDTARIETVPLQQTLRLDDRIATGIHHHQLCLGVAVPGVEPTVTDGVVAGVSLRQDARARHLGW